MSSASSILKAREAPPALIYAQREDPPPTWSDDIERYLNVVPRSLRLTVTKARLARLVGDIEETSSRLQGVSDAALRQEAAEVRKALRAKGLVPIVVARSFAVIRETAFRTIGLRHHDTQLHGGLVLLEGMLAEMDTGEGKTLTATLPVATAAMAGAPVHLITVNDYLAARDAEAMGPVYRALGLTVGTVVHGMPPHERRAAYLCDITYATNKEVAFDYLRDRIIMGRMTQDVRLKAEMLYDQRPRCNQLVMRGLHFAIVDEADSVLVDEARTPLIISSETDPGQEAEFAAQALQLSKALVAGEDYTTRQDTRQVELTELGKQRLAELGNNLGGLWRSTARREEAARQGLSALHLFRKDEDYIVRDGSVQIVDEYTGRIMADRSWNDGLHQLVELKEGCKVTGRKVPLARVSYQRFFRRYQRLGGMTGTAQEVAGELWSVYRLPVVRIPTHREQRRKQLPDRIYPTQEAKWRAIAARALELSRQGRPVLIGTRSVLLSEQVSLHLTAADVPHAVLNAKQDREEAQVIAEAGEAGRVTVATNMAGRGVDIRIAAEIERAGGLHVIISERHEAARIDRQLAGRCARHGERGSYELMLSLEDGILDFGGRRVAGVLTVLPEAIWQSLGRRLIRQAQRRAERMHSRIRRELLKADAKMRTVLAYAGEGD